MRRFQCSLLATFAAIGFASIASAADMPVKAPMAPVYATYNWTGWYVGLQGGAAWGRAEQTDAAGFTSGRYNTRGGLVGGTLGYNWQTGPVVFGLETDLSWASIKGSTSGTDPASGNTCGGSPPNCDSKITTLGTVRGRLGYAWQNLLPYVTGGLAYANVHGSEGDVAANGAFGSGSKWVAGWTVGGGLEGIIAPNWTAKLEYLYVNLGSRAGFTDTNGGVLVAQSLRETAQVVRVGINYRFAN